MRRSPAVFKDTAFVDPDSSMLPLRSGEPSSPLKADRVLPGEPVEVARMGFWRMFLEGVAVMLIVTLLVYII